MSESESSGNVGAITAIEDIDGEMIEMKAVDEGKRNEWIEHIKEKLEDIEGVQEVWGAGNRMSNNQTGQFEITVEHSDPPWGSGAILNANLHSLGQKIPNVFNSSHLIADYTVTMKPESITGNDRHDHPTYVVEFWLR